MRFLEVVLIAILVQQTIAKNNLRDGKQFPVFQVIRFPNDACISSGTLNGTCYTAEECIEKKGSSSGSCADGFGVCCIFSLSCGESNAENNTYLTLTATTTPPTSCNYQVLPSSRSISRMRLDLQTFVIANPRAIGRNVALSNLAGDSVGDCLTDTFVVSGGGKSSPVICGTNTGQHLFIDSDGMSPMCVNFMFGTGAGVGTRQYSIHVQQYDRLNLVGGPPGCLQYHTGDTGTLNSFNWNGIASTHLSSQNYQICIRRNQDKCIICYSEAISLIVGPGPPAAQQGSFGLSESNMPATIDAIIGKQCVNDYIEIPNGVSAIMAGVTSGVGINTAVVGLLAAAAGQPVGFVGNDRFCGRCFGQVGAGAPQPTFIICASGAPGPANLQSICTRTTPFRVGVFFDADENLSEGAADAAVGKANFNEASTGVAGVAGAAEPLGTQGFSIGFSQIGC